MQSLQRKTVDNYAWDGSRIWRRGGVRCMYKQVHWTWRNNLLLLLFYLFFKHRIYSQLLQICSSEECLVDEFDCGCWYSILPQGKILWYSYMHVAQTYGQLTMTNQHSYIFSCHLTSLSEHSLSHPLPFCPFPIAYMDTFPLGQFYVTVYHCKKRVLVLTSLVVTVPYTLESLRICMLCIIDHMPHAVNLLDFTNIPTTYFWNIRRLHG